MTRDQAYDAAKVFWGTGAMEAIDVWVKLGMLKLDEPECASEQALDAMFSFAATSGGMITPRHAVQAIYNAGLKIIAANSAAK